MQRILFVTDSLMAGGTEQQLVELVIRLDRTRFEPLVLCLYGERAGRSLHFLAQLQASGVPVYLFDLGWSTAHKVWAVTRIIKLVWQLRPALLHAVNYHSSLLVRLARPFIPPIMLVSSVYVPYTRKQLFYECLSGWMCACVICNSPVIQRQFAAMKMRIRFIPNGVDLSCFADGDDRGIRQQLASGARRVILMVGRISVQKSPHLVVEALGKLRDCGGLPAGTRLLVVGERESFDVQRLLDASIRRWQLEDVVIQLPATDQTEMFFRVADFTVLFSLWEGLPGVVLESLATGRPVVVSDAANNAGIVRHGVNGWVVPTGDIEMLAQVLASVLALSDEALKSMAVACQRSAAVYDMALMVRAYEQVYGELSRNS